ncbi:flagellar motor protein MotP [Bacillus salitolerans]|uniref:Flagellar motor protein MotP n=1 Tax=Bacillus salitolerans TaxID=1437434 RepID=A0ABW4LVU6_9BACI
MKKFDALTPFGMILGIIMIGLGIFSNKGFEGVTSFFDIPSLFIVLGGVTAGILISFNNQEVKKIFIVMRESFRKDNYDLPKLVKMIVRFSERARKEGLLSLEDEIIDIEDPFVRKGVLLAVDGMDGEQIEEILSSEIQAMEERHRKGRVLLEKAGEYAPSWGMIGTLIGLVLMLNGLNDPSTLGPNMAIALMTTLYGTLLANLVFLPMAAKLAMKTEQEVFVRQVIIQGIMGIQSGENPRLLREKLASYLTRDAQVESEEETEDEWEKVS